MFIIDFLEKVKICPICNNSDFENNISQFSFMDHSSPTTAVIEGDNMIIDSTSPTIINVNDNTIICSNKELQAKLYDLLETDIAIERQCKNCIHPKSDFSYSAKTNFVSFNQITNQFSPVVLEQEILEIYGEDDRAVLVNLYSQDGAIIAIFKSNQIEVDKIFFAGLIDIKTLNLKYPERAIQRLKNIILLL